MPLTHILLSAMLSLNPTFQDTLIDLTGDKIKERIIYHRSFTDSSSCQIFTIKDSTYTKLWELKFKIKNKRSYRIFFGYYNEDEILDFTIEVPNTGIFWYYTYDKKKKKFIMKE